MFTVWPDQQLFRAVSSFGYPCSQEPRQQFAAVMSCPSTHSAGLGRPSKCPIAVGFRPTVVSYPSNAFGFPPTGFGYLPTAVSFAATYIGYTPTHWRCRPSKPVERAPLLPFFWLLLIALRSHPCDACLLQVASFHASATEVVAQIDYHEQVTKWLQEFSPLPTFCRDWAWVAAFRAYAIHHRERLRAHLQNTILAVAVVINVLMTACHHRQGIGGPYGWRCGMPNHQPTLPWPAPCDPTPPYATARYPTISRHTLQYPTYWTLPYPTILYMDNALPLHGLPPSPCGSTGGGGG